MQKKTEEEFHYSFFCFYLPYMSFTLWELLAMH